MFVECLWKASCAAGATAAAAAADGDADEDATASLIRPLSQLCPTLARKACWPASTRLPGLPSAGGSESGWLCTCTQFYPTADCLPASSRKDTSSFITTKTRSPERRTSNFFPKAVGVETDSCSLSPPRYRPAAFVHTVTSVTQLQWRARYHHLPSPRSEEKSVSRTSPSRELRS